MADNDDMVDDDMSDSSDADSTTQGSDEVEEMDETQSVDQGAPTDGMNDVDDYAQESKEKNDEGIIVIGGKDLRRVITDDEPISLQIDGTYSYITVASGAVVTSVEINGNGNKITLTGGSTPVIIDNGQYNQVYCD